MRRIVNDDRGGVGAELASGLLFLPMIAFTIVIVVNIISANVHQPATHPCIVNISTGGCSE